MVTSDFTADTVYLIDPGANSDLHGDARDDKAYRAISAHTRKHIISIEVTALAKKGGAVRCVTCGVKRNQTAQLLDDNPTEGEINGNAGRN